MKKIFLMMFVTIIAVTSASGAFAQDTLLQTGIIKEMTGEVKLKLAGTSDFVPAIAGDLVAPDTIISTGFRSIALIEVGSAIISVRPLTQLSFAELRNISNTEILDVKLSTGRIRVNVRPPEGAKVKFSVQSVQATASVRGTSFDFDTRNIKVHEGKVAFQGNNGMPRAVRAGSSSYVDLNGAALNPSAVDMEALQPSSPIGTDLTASSPALPPPTSGEIHIGIGY